MFYKISIPSERSGPVAVRFKNRKLLALVMLAPAMCFAADFSHEGISYNLLSDGKIEVCAAEEGSVYTGTISIPRMVQYNGEHRLVAGIGRHAFPSSGGEHSLYVAVLPDRHGPKVLPKSERTPSHTATALPISVCYRNICVSEQGHSATAHR